MQINSALLYLEFKRDLPELAALNFESYERILNIVKYFLPLRVSDSQSRACPLEVKNKILNLLVAHWYALYNDANADEDTDGQIHPLSLQRTPLSLSTDGLSVSYGEISPKDDSLGAYYDWLSRSAYGDLAKVLSEKCLSGALGVFIA